MDELAIHQWLAVLDTLSYYEVFRVRPDASPDELRRAFHVFAEAFHPDVHNWRPPAQKDALGRIYRRGTEAYRVLSEPGLRARYDQSLAGGVTRSEALVTESESLASRPPPSRSSRPSDHVRVPAARTFVLRAEELMKKGDPGQAKLQLVMALSRDTGNPALEAFAREIDAAVASKRASYKR